MMRSSVFTRKELRLIDLQTFAPESPIFTGFEINTTFTLRHDSGMCPIVTHFVFSLVECV